MSEAMQSEQPDRQPPHHAFLALNWQERGHGAKHGPNPALTETHSELSSANNPPKSQAELFHPTLDRLQASTSARIPI